MKGKSISAKLFYLFLIVALLLPGVAAPSAYAAYRPVGADNGAPPSTIPPTDPLPPEPWPALFVSVNSFPEKVVAGGQVTLTVQVSNVGDTIVHGVIISGTLPAGLECQRCEPFYSPGNRRLHWTLGTLEIDQTMTFAFAAQVQESAAWEGEVVLDLSARGVETEQETHQGGVVRVPYPLRDAPSSVVLPAGSAGQLVSADGRLTVTLPMEAVGAGLTTAYSPTASPRGEAHRPLRHFYLNAQDPLGQEVHTFTAPVEIVYHYTRAEARDLDPSADLFLFRWDEQAQAWIQLSTEVDPEHQLLTARTDHFSEFLVGGYIQLPSDDYLPVAQGFQEIDLFTGASVYSYPIGVPAGRGGLAPQLALSYSSGNVDWPGSPEDSLIQAGWVGYGWSLGESYIARQDILGSRFTPDDCNEQNDQDDDSRYAYSLVLNGASYDLVKGTDGYYHTSEETFWRIERFDGGHGQPIRWTVKTKDGTSYTFAEINDQPVPAGATLWQMMCRPNDTDCQANACNLGTPQVYKVMLARVQDTHGNTIDYIYTHESDTGQDCGNPSDPTKIYGETYLRQIQYNGNPTSGYLTKIDFYPGRRLDDYAPANDRRYPRQFRMLFKLDAIVISQKVGTQWQDAHVYFFNYDYTTYNDTDTTNSKLTLRDVQSCGIIGPFDYLCLPKTRFGYLPMIDWSGNPQVGRNRLYSVWNGFGGQLMFDYEVVPNLPYRNRVLHRIVSDGMTSSSRWTYSYTGAAINKPNAGTDPNLQACNPKISDDAAQNSPRSRRWREFRGHESVTVTDPSGNKQKHWFHLTDNKRGKEKRTDYMDASGALYRQVAITNTVAPIGASHAYVDNNYDFADPEIAFTYVSQVDDYTYDGTTQPTAHKEARYSYDTTYGNLLDTKEYSFPNGVETLYRTTSRSYVPNPTQWIVDRVYEEAVFSGAGDRNNITTYAALSWYYYDNNTLPTQMPTVGELRKVQKMYNGVLNGSYFDWYTSEVSYAYTGYGELQQETTNPSNGQMRQLATPPYTIDPQSIFPGPSQACTTQITYDSNLGIYPVTVTYPDPGHHFEQATYDYRLGVLLSYTDANNNTTNYRYDDLGRVVKVWKPGDDGTYPTTQVTYSDWGTPNLQRVLVQQREESSQPGTLDEEQYFDGLGRKIQVHQEATGGQEVVVTTLYDRLGRESAEVVPYLVGATVGYVAPGTKDTNPRTEYSYDPLGRLYNTTNTNDSVVRTRYNGWQVATIDENDHAVVHASDAFGRLVQVNEYTGDFGDPFNWSASPYATTGYIYNVLDLLTEVTDAAGNHTKMHYDLLGRKEQMHDPDMHGSDNYSHDSYWWTYKYDAQGNLTRQTDANGQLICFYYDSMSRLAGKFYAPDSTCPSPPPYFSVSYTYDEESNGVGHRTGMTDASGNTTWTYDQRGRLQQEQRVISGGLGTFTTQWQYDAMDRVKSIQYPGDTSGGPGEIVAYAYDTRGLLYSTLGAY